MVETPHLPSTSLIAKVEGDGRDIPKLSAKSYAEAVRNTVCPEPAIILGTIAHQDESFIRKMKLAGPSKAQNVEVKLDTGAEGDPGNYVRASMARTLELDQVQLEEVIQVVGACGGRVRCTHFVILHLFDPNWKVHLVLKALLLPDSISQFQIIIGAKTITRNGLMDLHTHGRAFARTVFSTQ